MKKIKFTVCLLIALIIVVYNGELFQDYLNHFEAPFDYTTFNKPQSVKQSQMTEDLKYIAKQNCISFFTVLTKDENALSVEKQIYISDNSVIDVIREQCRIQPKKYKSLFLGETTIQFYDISEIPDINLAGNYYLIGDINNQDMFKQQAIGLYGGGLVKDGVKDNSEIKTIISLWLIVIAVSLLLTEYEILLNKKETHIKLMLGEKAIVVFLKNILQEFSFFLLASVLLFAITSLFTTSLFLIEYSALMLICMLIANAMLYLGVFRHNYKEAFSKYGSSVALLSASYAIKIAASILTVLIVSANFVVILEAISFRTQKDFFKAHSDYVYIDLMFSKRSNKTGDDAAKEGLELIRKSDKLLLEIYKYCFREHGVSIYSDIGKSIGSNEQIALFNQSAKEYLVNNINDLDENKRLFVNSWGKSKKMETNKWWKR